MFPSDQEKWRAQHIPHRLRVCLAGSPLQRELMLENIATYCIVAAAAEGRMAAIRWLIEFVGIRDFKGRPGRPNRHRTDVSISLIQGGKEIDLSSPEAATLASVWKACSQASGHPTQDTNHPDIDGQVIDKALRIIISQSQTNDLLIQPRRINGHPSAFDVIFTDCCQPFAVQVCSVQVARSLSADPQ
jgi:hypothetical protein